MSNTVKFGYRVMKDDGTWSTKKYPHDLHGTPKYNLATGEISGAVHGVDRDAVEALRDGQRRDKTIGLTARNATRVAQKLTDGPGITASEIPVMKAARYAAEGRTVQVTDGHGHWRDLTTTPMGAVRFLNAMEGARVVKPSKPAEPATPTEPTAPPAPTEPTAPASTPRGSTVVAGVQGAVDGLARWHESGDNGVDPRVVHLEGVASLQAAVDQLAGILGSGTGELLPAEGRAAVDGFRSSAAESLEAWRPTFYDDGIAPPADENSAAMQAFDDAVKTTFGPLAEVRAAHTSTGADCLIGKVDDGYVAVVMWPYRDG